MAKHKTRNQRLGWVLLCCICCFLSISCFFRIWMDGLSWEGRMQSIIFSRFGRSGGTSCMRGKSGCMGSSSTCLVISQVSYRSALRFVSLVHGAVRGSTTRRSCHIFFLMVSRWHSFCSGPAAAMSMISS